MGKWILAMALVVGIASPVAAQDTIALYFSDPVDGLRRWGNTPTGVFDIVVLMKSNSGSAFAEFVMDEILVLVPGVFKTGTTKINNSPIDGGDNSLGEYAIDFGDCVEAGEVEVVRVSYLDFGDLIPEVLVLGIRGFREGDTLPSRFGGEMGYADCFETHHVLTGEPWPESDHCDFPGGACCLNRYYWWCVPTAADNFTALKTRY